MNLTKTTVALVALLTLCTSGVAGQTKIESALFNRTEPGEDRVNPSSYQEYQPIPYKSVTLAVALSVLVPGTGELYAGNFETGKYALMAEAAIWVTYAALATHSNWVRQDARIYATVHAGVSFNSKNDKFDVDIGNYGSLEEYNLAKLRNRENDLLYTDPSYYWRWDSDADRIAFKSARIRSDQIYQNAKFVIAAAVVNRIVSAFSAGRATAAYNRKVLIDGAWNIEAYPTSSLRFADGLTVNVSYGF